MKKNPYHSTKTKQPVASVWRLLLNSFVGFAAWCASVTFGVHYHCVCSLCVHSSDHMCHWCSLFPLQRSVSKAAEKTLCCCCCAKGPIKLAATINKLGFCNGDQIELRIVAENQTDRDLGHIKVSLVRQGVGQVRNNRKYVPATQAEFSSLSCILVFSCCFIERRGVEESVLGALFRPFSTFFIDTPSASAGVFSGVSFVSKFLAFDLHVLISAAALTRELFMLARRRRSFQRTERSPWLPSRCQSAISAQVLPHRLFLCSTTWRYGCLPGSIVLNTQYWAPNWAWNKDVDMCCRLDSHTLKFVSCSPCGFGGIFICLFLLLDVITVCLLPCRHLLGWIIIFFFIHHFHLCTELSTSSVCKWVSCCDTCAGFRLKLKCRGGSTAVSSLTLSLGQLTPAIRSGRMWRILSVLCFARLAGVRTFSRLLVPRACQRWVVLTVLECFLLSCLGYWLICVHSYFVPECSFQ